MSFPLAKYDPRDMSHPYFERVYAVVWRIPQGKVATYGQIAKIMGEQHGARYVGFALHTNPYPGQVPCHRVVFSDGGLAPGFAFGGPSQQRRLLESEGVTFTQQRSSHDLPCVDLDQCQWSCECYGDEAWLSATDKSQNSN